MVARMLLKDMVFEVVSEVASEVVSGMSRTVFLVILRLPRWAFISPGERSRQHRRILWMARPG